MSRYLVCKKCGDSEIYLQYRGMQVGAYCSNCGSWIKWVGKKDLPIYKSKGLKIFAEGHKVALKRDAPLGVIVEEKQVKPSTFKSNVLEKDLPFESDEHEDIDTQEWEREYAQRVNREQVNQVGKVSTDLAYEVEIEKRVKARLIVERDGIEEEIERRVQERLKDYDIQREEKEVKQDEVSYCSVCDGAPLVPYDDKEKPSQVDVSIFDGVLTITNIAGDKLLGVYVLKRCPECGREFERAGM